MLNAPSCMSTECSSRHGFLHSPAGALLFRAETRTGPGPGPHSWWESTGWGPDPGAPAPPTLNSRSAPHLPCTPHPWGAVTSPVGPEKAATGGGGVSSLLFYPLNLYLPCPWDSEAESRPPPFNRLEVRFRGDVAHPGGPVDRWLTLDPKPGAGSRPRGPHGPAGTSGPLRLDAPGRWGLQAASGHASAPRGSQDAAPPGTLADPCVSDGALCPSLSRRRPGPRRAALQWPLPGGDRAPPTSPCCRCRGRPPLQVSGGGGGGWRARPHPRGPLGPLLVPAPRDPPSVTRPPHRLRTRVQARPARREEARDAPHVGGAAHGARAAPARRRPRPAPLGLPRAHAGLSSREPLGRGPERQLPGDAQLPGELRPRRPRPERSPLRRVIPRGGPRTTRAPGSGWDPHPRGDLGKASSSSRRVHASRQLPPPRPAQARPASPRPPTLDTVSPHPVTPARRPDFS